MLHQRGGGVCVIMWRPISSLDMAYYSDHIWIPQVCRLAQSHQYNIILRDHNIPLCKTKKHITITVLDGGSVVLSPSCHHIIMWRPISSLDMTYYSDHIWIPQACRLAQSHQYNVIMRDHNSLAKHYYWIFLLRKSITILTESVTGEDGGEGGKSCQFWCSIIYGWPHLQSQKSNAAQRFPSLHVSQLYSWSRQLLKNATWRWSEPTCQ